ncbi:MAG TPA: folate-binding protein [Ghiorsea sp.]|nr:folate-binding protein [Ghiorsea sp.]HIP06379.1 folate-binding protein [Mariprofundaceae bacterium]
MKISQQTTFDIIKASGENILTYLQGQISQNIKLMSSEQALYAVILNPQGKAVTDFYLLQTQAKGNWAEVMFLCPSAFALNLVERLRMFAMGYELRMGKVSSWQVMGVQGDDVDGFLAQQKLPIPAVNKLAAAHDEHVSVLRTPELSGNGVWVVGANLALQANIEESEAECERILQGIPRLGIDWTTKLHPLNANLIERGGVDFDKGCYVGQEVTSRMHWRGGIKKKLYRVQLEKEVDLPCPVLTTAKVGEITSLAKGGDVYQGIALLPIETVDAEKTLQTEAGDTVRVIGVCGE